ELLRSHLGSPGNDEAAVWLLRIQEAHGVYENVQPLVGRDQAEEEKDLFVLPETEMRPRLIPRECRVWDMRVESVRNDGDLCRVNAEVAHELGLRWLSVHEDVVEQRIHRPQHHAV